ncbi:unnamed protein product [Rotaria magnacalcarata]|uniref:Alpha/beta hydrolase n=1 Tax=Rotaria magnacalcarata TaxID=392030 RepID=A0A816BDQ4_9BILA|nr:unnamed protein product [Rotaria magnacalcarata]CAF4603561.1 unnamed protein product [Rotaria magnacalcarata]
MIVQPSAFKLVLFGIFACGVGVVLLNVVSYGKRQGNYELSNKETVMGASNRRSGEPILSKTNSKLNTKSGTFTDKKIGPSKVSIRTYQVAWDKAKSSNVVVHESGEGDNHVLLLHGRKFSSETWKKIGTLQNLTLWGYRAYAIDIPHSGNDSLPVTGDKAAVQWLTKVISKLHLSNLVIISPSMSGRLTLPYMFQLKKQQQLIRGFVYISPVGTKQYQASDFTQVKIPTLVVHGEKDTEFLPAFEALKTIPASEGLLIKNASHNSYYEKPLEFHQGLRRFLEKVYRSTDKTSPKSLKKKSLLRNTTKLYNKRKQ